MKKLDAKISTFIGLEMALMLLNVNRPLEKVVVMHKAFSRDYSQSRLG